jgi:hypothetical protein
MLKPDCLHCVLVAAFVEWMKTHNADVDEIVGMIATATAQSIRTLGPYRGKEMDLVILGLKRAAKTQAEREKMN